MAGRPQYRRFGFVDFDAMSSLPSSDDADEFVCRRANGDNVLVTRADIIAGAGSVPDPLLLSDGSAVAPTYSFTSDPDTGFFKQVANNLGVSIAGTIAYAFDTTQMGASGSTGAAIKKTGVSSINPTMIPRVADPNTGIGSNALDQLSLIAGGVEGIRVSEAGAVINVTIAGDTTVTGKVLVANAAGPAMLDEAASATNPTLIPDQSMDDTGIGSIAGIDQLTLIGGGLRCMAVSKVGASPAIAFYEGSPITLQTGVAVTTAAIHAACVALRLFTA